ncbi:MAG: AAA family ATPase [Malacoplasma sp.]|nr:AAA family ATPase [Malacoplasma sp.]
MIHISVEGMDGAGKSTICELLAKKLNYVFVEKPLHFLLDDNNEISRYREIAKRVNSNPNRNFTAMFYGLGSIYMYEMFKDKNIITDRHLASNYAWSGTDYNSDIYDLIIKKIGTPKITVILYATHDVIVKRLKMRNKEDNNIAKANMSETIYAKMIAFCKLHNFFYKVIDTSYLTPDAIVNQIMKELGYKS